MADHCNLHTIAMNQNTRQNKYHNQNLVDAATVVLVELEES